MGNERARRWNADRRDVVGHVGRANPEAGMGKHGPAEPRIADRNIQSEDGPVIEAERTPAHETRSAGPRHPGGAPMPIGNPEPTAARKAPSSVMVGRPPPEIVVDPGPSIPRHRIPVAVVVRPPAGGDRRIPDVPV